MPKTEETRTRCANSYYTGCESAQRGNSWFCSDACAAQWADSELTNAMDRGDFDWCAGCAKLVVNDLDDLCACRSSESVYCDDCCRGGKCAGHTEDNDDNA